MNCRKRLNVFLGLPGCWRLARSMNLDVQREQRIAIILDFNPEFYLDDLPCSRLSVRRWGSSVRFCEPPQEGVNHAGQKSAARSVFGFASRMPSALWTGQRELLRHRGG